MDSMPSSASDESFRPQTAAQASTVGIIDVDENTLLAHPALLHRAMMSTLRAGDIPAVLALLPVYEKSDIRQTVVVDYVHAIKALAREDYPTAAARLRQVLAHQPQAHTVRAQLVETLLAMQDYRGADEQLTLLPNEALPESLQARVNTYRGALEARNKWKFYAAARLMDDDNINQAPYVRKAGNWLFEAPVRDQGLGYQTSAAKSWDIHQGLDARLRFDAHGRHYLRHGRYNDTIVRVTPALGVPSRQSSVSIGPFLQYRRFGNTLHARTLGLSMEHLRYWMPHIQSLAALEIGRDRHTLHPHLDSKNLSLSTSLRYRHRNAQHWLVAHDYYREWGARDASDTFTHFGLRLAWERQWPSGTGLKLTTTGALRHYQGPTLLSNAAPRRDRQHSMAISAWHNELSVGRLIPRLTLSRSLTASNDTRMNYRKTRLVLETSTSF